MNNHLCSAHIHRILCVTHFIEDNLGDVILLMHPGKYIVNILVVVAF